MKIPAVLPHILLLLDSDAQWLVVSLTTCLVKARPEVDVVAFVCMQKKQVGRNMVTIMNICVSVLLKEEEIPELEIDIDELLELTDEGQRIRLQVRINKRT